MAKTPHYGTPGPLYLDAVQGWCSKPVRLSPMERDAIVGALKAQLDRARMTQTDKEIRYRLIRKIEAR